jgi:hypothetical protein
MDEFYISSADNSHAKEYIDSREAFRGLPIIAPQSLRMLYVDEFTTSLLVNFTNESSAYFIALVGWGNAHILESVSYGYGDISYYPPNQVAIVAIELNATPQEFLEEWFKEQADNFRRSAAGYFRDDQAILAHQHTFADFLCRFYDEAAHDGNFVLLLIV